MATITITLRETGQSVTATLKAAGEGEKSMYKILLFSGIDSSNRGTYGSNVDLAKYIETICSQPGKYYVPLRKGDIIVLNAPFIANDIGGNDIYNSILNNIKSNNFDLQNGTLIIYAYSFGAQYIQNFIHRFKKDNIKISLLITIDAAYGPYSSTINNDIPDNVKFNLNIFQLKPSGILSHGWWNEGKNVKNVGITFNRDSKGNLISHATIDEYTLFYCAQVIIYALKGIYSFIYYSENEIEEQIRMYHSTGF